MMMMVIVMFGFVLVLVVSDLFLAFGLMVNSFFFSLLMAYCFG